MTHSDNRAIHYNLLQRTLLGCYAKIEQAGLLRSSALRWLFIKAYFSYKRNFEDPFLVLTRKHPKLFQGGFILDIGANIGYTATVFSRAVSSSFKVIAFEPDPSNVEMLSVVARHFPQIEIVRSAVGERDGTISFWSNPQHHADGRTVTDAFAREREDLSLISVPLVSIDSYLRCYYQDQPISFIKIDVQGYEEKVLEGCQETISRNPHIAIAFEYMPAMAKEMGLDPLQLIKFLRDRDFQLYLLDRTRGLESVKSSQLEAMVQSRGYCDILASRQAAVT